MAEFFIPGDVRASGQGIFGSLVIPPSSIDNAALRSGQNFDASKFEQQYKLNYNQVPGTAVVAATSDLGIVRGATGLVIGLSAALTGTAISGGSDRTITIDLQKSTGGAAFATLLSGLLTLNASTVVRVAAAGSLIGSPTLVAGDLLRVVVALTGSTGTQGQGLVVSASIREKAD